MSLGCIWVKAEILSLLFVPFCFSTAGSVIEWCLVRAGDRRSGPSLAQRRPKAFSYTGS